MAKRTKAAVRLAKYASQLATRSTPAKVKSKAGREMGKA